MGNATIIAATITAVGTLLGVLLQRFRRENRKDHAEVINELRWLRRIVERVETKHDQHIDKFHQGEPSGRFERASQAGAKQDD